MGHQESVMNARLLEVTWVAGKQTPTIGSAADPSYSRIKLAA
jgi:hypothetical protein